MEFWMIEPEVAFATLEDTMDLAEGLISCILDRVLTRRKAELETLERDAAPLEQVSRPFPRISYDEAVRRLQASGSEIQWGGDLGGGDETILSEQFTSPVMIHRYPSAVKASRHRPHFGVAGRNGNRRLRSSALGFAPYSQISKARHT
jgi:asparaginyl-tRNA synthetase